MLAFQFVFNTPKPVITAIKRQVFEAINYLGYRFFKKDKPI